MMSTEVLIYSVAGSFVAGVCTGIFIKFMTKLILLFAGFVSFLLAVLSALGIVTVRWDALGILIQKVISALGGYASAVLVLGVPFVTGCVLGMMIRLPHVVTVRRRPRYL